MKETTTTTAVNVNVKKKPSEHQVQIMSLPLTHPVNHIMQKFPQNSSAANSYLIFR